MQIVQSNVSNNSRFLALDVVKGLVMIEMACTHCTFFFLESFTYIKPFQVFDPFVFSTFLLCFGVGNGLSRRSKRIEVLGKLCFVYLVGGLPGAIVAYLLAHPEASISLVPTFAFKQLIQAATLQGRLALADFLVPFIVAYAVFLAIQPLFREFNRRTITIAVAFSIAFYLGGFILTQVEPNAPLRDFYSNGFRSLQSFPIFLAGVCLGLFLRQKGFPSLRLSVLAVIAAVFLSLLVFSYLQYEHYSYLNGGQGWKKSGELSYTFFGLVIPILLLFVVEGILRLTSVQKYVASVVSVLSQIGKKTLRCLWIQFLLFPATGYIVSTKFVQSLHVLMALVAIGLMCWLTINDQFLSNPSQSNRSAS